ncbi:MAG: hypothetical protein QM742_08840 [Aquabacterium sp.]
MEKSHPPKTFGVFKPVGHVVMAFSSDDDLHAAENALSGRGFAWNDIVAYTPEEMLAQTADDLQSASPLAHIGQDMNLVKAHRAYAEAGCHFLVVRAGDDAHAQMVAEVARDNHAAAAQHYGRWIVEELISTPHHAHQVFESPDRGLDLDIDRSTRH